jgi:uncharacterized protein YkwD
MSPHCRAAISLVAALALTGVAALRVASPAEASPLRAQGVLAAARGAWPGDAASKEAAFVADINALRASRRLPALKVNPNLVAKARGWAATMAGAGSIRHSALPLGVTANWRKLGENVGRGGSEPGLHDAFVASPRHFKNLVDPAFGYVGIGVVNAGSSVFVSEVFMQLVPVHRRVANAVRRRPRSTDRDAHAAAAGSLNRASALRSER